MVESRPEYGWRPPFLDLMEHFWGRDARRDEDMTRNIWKK